MVLFTEMPEAFDIMDQIVAAGECALDTAKEVADDVEGQANEAIEKVDDQVNKELEGAGDDDKVEEEKSSDPVWEFNTDVDGVTDDIDETANEL